MKPSEEQGAPRQTRRRAETRRRMLDAAAGIVEELGLTAATVETVCARAGYSRGAFYSNFASMDDLLIALFEQRAELVAAHLSERFAAAVAPGSVEDLVAQVLASLPMNRQWFQVSTEMTAQALRRPEAAAALDRHRAGIREFLAGSLGAALTRLGRVPVIPVEDLADAVLAMYEGTLAQIHLDAAGQDRQRLFLARTILALTS